MFSILCIPIKTIDLCIDLQASTDAYDFSSDIDPDSLYGVFVSYIEIYNEKIIDLGSSPSKSYVNTMMCCFNCVYDFCLIDNSVTL